MMVRVDEIRCDASRSMPSVRPLHAAHVPDAYRKPLDRKERLRAALEKAQPAPNRSPHATSETGRTLMLLLGFDVALMRRSTIISIS